MSVEVSAVGDEKALKSHSPLRFSVNSPPSRESIRETRFVDVARRASSKEGVKTPEGRIGSLFREMTCGSRTSERSRPGDVASADVVPCDVVRGDVEFCIDLAFFSVELGPFSDFATEHLQGTIRMCLHVHLGAEVGQHRAIGTDHERRTLVEQRSGPPDPEKPGDLAIRV